jgi:Na+-driven multidrug efflux pump
MVLAVIVAQSGSDASAGFQTAIRLVMFFLLPAWGISNAAATLVGQNLGAGRPERAEQSVRTIALYNAIFMGAVMIIFLIFAEPLLDLFIVDITGLQFKIAVESMRIISSGYILYGIGMVLMQAFNGAGDSWTPTYISIVGFWLIQIPLAFFLSFTMDFGPTGAFLAIPLAEAIIAGIYWYYFNKGKWKTIKV